jgi:hypothetical protein
VGRLPIPTHLDQSNYLANEQQVFSFDVHLLHQPQQNVLKNAGPKLILLSQTGMF